MTTRTAQYLEVLRKVREINLKEGTNAANVGNFRERIACVSSKRLGKRP